MDLTLVSVCSETDSPGSSEDTGAGMPRCHLTLGLAFLLQVVMPVKPFFYDQLSTLFMFIAYQ